MTCQPNTRRETGAEAKGGAPDPKRSPAWGGLWRTLRRFFWMDDQLAAATRVGFGPGSPGWDAFHVGCAAARVADRLGESREFEGARLLLYRSAAALLAGAHLTRAGIPPSAAPVGDQERKRPADLRGESRADTGHSVDRAAAADSHDPLGDPGDEFELGCQAVRAAEKIRESGESESGTHLLHRAAAALFVRAQLARPEGNLPPPALRDQDWDRLVELSSAAREFANLPEAQRGLVTACLGSQGESHVATLSRAERRATARRLARLAQELAAPLQAEARIVRRVVMSRWLRLGISVALPVAVIAYGVIERGWFQNRNLALHRPVIVSSIFAVNIGRNPSLLVDGDTSNLGFHTADAAHQHVTIDLGSTRRVRKVVVYNRVDCCKARAVPLRVEVSQDGDAYRQVAKRDTVFNVWEATLPPLDARYVRLTRPKKAYFHLAEVEVY